MRPSATRIAASYWLMFIGLLAVTCTSEGDVVNMESHRTDLASEALNVENPIGSFISPVEVHEVVVTLEQVYGEPNTPKHTEAKSKLLDSLRKDHGTWNTNHPRHRLLDALHGFTRYHERQKAEVDRLRRLYQQVSKPQRLLLEDVLYHKKFSKIDHILSENQQLCDRIVQNALEFYGVNTDELQKHIKDIENADRKAEKVSVSQALKHYVRDWTEPGKNERDEPFACLLKTLDGMFPDRDETAPIKALLPGAGLGRLGHDVARLGGFEVTINEWSMYMNVAYRFLETHRTRNSESLHPFIDGWSHHVTEADMYRELSFPDVNINASSVVMVEGDFTTAFKGQQRHYDVVVTYFFIDTARNLMAYFETIKKVLKTGGHWINLGPLLYGTGPFVQLTLEEIIQVTEIMGFEYLDTDESCGSLTLPGRTVRGMAAIYGFDERALTKHAYNAQFWVARKS